MVPLIIAPKAGTLDGRRGVPLPVQRTYLTARSVEFDALLIAGGPIPTDPRVPPTASGNALRMPYPQRMTRL
jgi:catalase